ncbi:MAG: hypothetical protein KIT37_06570 [Steroidobacteraceae bacterium]|nr:hypothetical protein [Steroidobacteraceae bacterium]
MTLLKCVTVSVDDVDSAARRYVEWLDYEVVEQGRLPADVAQSWAAPATAGRRYSLLRPASGADVFIRLIGDCPGERAPAFTTLGWIAMEICVQDVLAVNARMMSSPFRIIGPPEPMSSLPAIYPMQVTGPDGDVIYFTQIKSRKPGSGLPQARSPIDHLFIMIMGCADVDVTHDWFARQLALEPRMTMEIEHGLLRRAFGLPEGSRFRLRTMQHAGHVCLEFDQLPAAAAVPMRRDGDIPAGLALTTVVATDLDCIPGPWITPPAPRTGALYAGCRSGALRTPDGALLEVLEWPGSR